MFFRRHNRKLLTLMRVINFRFLLICSKVPLNVGLQATCSRLIKIGFAESISGDKFATGSRINVHTARLCRKNVALSSDMVSGL